MLFFFHGKLLNNQRVVWLVSGWWFGTWECPSSQLTFTHSMIFQRGRRKTTNQVWLVWVVWVRGVTVTMIYDEGLLTVTSYLTQLRSKLHQELDCLFFGLRDHVASLCSCYHWSVCVIFFCCWWIRSDKFNQLRKTLLVQITPITMVFVGDHGIVNQQTSLGKHHLVVIVWRSPWPFDEAQIHTECRSMRLIHAVFQCLDSPMWAKRSKVRPFQIGSEMIWISPDLCCTWIIIYVYIIYKYIIYNVSLPVTASCQMGRSSLESPKPRIFPNSRM